MNTPNDNILALCARRREINQRLRRFLWPALRERLQAELIEVADEMLRLDCRRLDSLRERMTPCGEVVQ